MKSLAIVTLLCRVAFADGGIKGTVIFVGEAPDRPKLERKTDPYCAKTDKLSEDVVVTNGKLKDVFVRIKSAPPGAHPAPATPVVIDQHECMYTPRVVGMMAGQKLAVRNSDDNLGYWATARTIPCAGEAQDARCAELRIDQNGRRFAVDSKGEDRSADCWH